MTMLDRMRRHKGWLKWSLAIVVVAFVALYIPSFLQNERLNGASNYGVVATVEGHDITVGRFRRVYQQQMQAYRNAYGGQMDERLLKQLGVDQRIVQQLIEEEAALVEARRQNITASDAEVRARILALPAFQENGHFIGDARYRQLLQMQNPPINPGEFEEEVRRSVVLEKLQGALTDWITVGDADVTAEFNRRNEKVKLAVVAFPADKFKDGVAATDAEVSDHFEKNKETYRIPEKRKIKYALIDLQSLRQRTTVSAQDVQRYYEENKQQYSTPEQVRASHILLKTEGKDDAAVKKQAEDVLAKVKGGADFAALATKLSEDETSAVKGGDLDFFNRGAMVKEFDDAAFSMKVGETSGLVKTQFGYHIIRVTDKKPASTRTLEESRAQIEDLLKSERAQKEADRVSTELAGKLTKPEDLDTVAKGRGLTVSETGFFGRNEPIVGLGFAQEVSSRAFEMKTGEVSESIRSQNGPVFITVTGTQEARLPALDEVKARVRDDVQRAKAVEAARQKAAAVSAQLKSAADFAAAAKSAGLEAKTTDLVLRGAALPDVGVSPAVDTAAFALPQGGVSDPVVTDTGAVIVKVIEKKMPTADELKNGRDQLKTELVNQQKQRFYGSYMTKARERMSITSNPQVIAQVVG
jgi:peptidyl-prolyl cis-trans isomerase D